MKIFPSLSPGDHTQPGAAQEVLRLAVPAFAALVAEPAFLLADAAIVGRLGTAPLAGLGVASAALAAAAGVFVFLAYGTTGAVARRSGAGDRRGALAVGLDGVWLALLLGVVTGVALLLSADRVAAAFGASPAASGAATTYLRISALGLPSMLVSMAATGVLRGLQDTRTPLVVALVGFTTNIGLNVLLVLGLSHGIAGSATGTVLAQTGMAVALVTVVVRGVRRITDEETDGGGMGLPLRPHPWRVLAAARLGLPLLVRTLALRGVLLLTTWAAAAGGDVSLAAYQVSATVWTFLTFALDALAIAAQALTGRALGAGDADEARALTSLMVRWGVLAGVVLGLLVLVTSPLVPAAFTTDPAVRAALTGALVVVAVQQPLSGLVFVLDGVLIGAGDGRWLAGAQILLLVAYLPVALAVRGVGATAAVLWCGFAVFMALRGLALSWRARGDAWAVVGAAR
ncbi:MAG TPA: MATE family efflux transporter [Actinomycetales bacterium]|nr:MATE family efflux transporter [Actinomycetales bacterium]